MSAFFNTHKDYHHLSQNATNRGLVERRGFINSNPKRSVLAGLPNVVYDYPTIGGYTEVVE
jgi:hypothetical protein